MQTDKTIDEWKQRGSFLQIFNHNVFVVDEHPQVKQGERSPICILHGFPSSSIDFRPALPILSKFHRVVLVDFIGFGFSDKPPNDFSYSLIEQTDMIVEVWRKLKLDSVHIIAHDYGTSVLTELLARRERGQLPQLSFRSITFCNGSFHIEHCSLAITQQLLLTPGLNYIAASFFNEFLFTKQLKRICSASLSEQEIQIMWKLLARNNGKSKFSLYANHCRSTSKTHQLCQ
jgi:pimeloyl-ACP methyl ester carboxylesterase